MSLEFIPSSIKEIAHKYNAKLRLVSSPQTSKQFEHVNFATIELTTNDASPLVELVNNTNRSTEYQVDAVIVAGKEFSGEHPDILLDILCSILEGRLHEKQTIFGKKKLFVLDTRGNRYWAREH